MRPNSPQRVGLGVLCRHTPWRTRRGVNGLLTAKTTSSFAILSQNLVCLIAQQKF